MYYENFARLCEQKGVRPGTVGRETNISTATLTAWKQGKYTPKTAKLEALAGYFGVPITEIIGGETENDMILTEEQKRLINGFDMLDDVNQQKVLEYIQALESIQSANVILEKVEEKDA